MSLIFPSAIPEPVTVSVINQGEFNTIVNSVKRLTAIRTPRSSKG